jgi:single-strand DNA-binding protein
MTLAIRTKRARSTGHCTTCGRPTRPGQQIALLSDPGWVHTTCALRLRTTTTEGKTAMALPTLTGTARLTHDPDLSFTGNGIARATIKLAFNSRRKNDAGDWEDGDSFFITGTLWREQAEAAAEHLSKGTEVIVTGRPKTRSYETREGEKRTTTELMIDAIAPTVRAVAKKADRGNGQRPGIDPWAEPAPASAERAPF